MTRSQHPIRLLALVLVLAITVGVVGVTGCTEILKVSEAIKESEREELSARHYRMREAVQKAAANGDAAAMVRASTFYNPITDNLPEVVALLERASQKQFAPAQFMLGGLLLDGEAIYLIGRASESDIPRQPERGLDLLKRAASQTCIMKWSLNPANKDNNPAFEISQRLQKGQGLVKNIGESQLWLARSVLHCHYPDIFATSRELRNSIGTSPMSPAERIAWAMLYGAKDDQSQKLLTYLKARASSADIKLAEERSEQLRSIVAESEREYARPSKLEVTVVPWGG